MGSQSIPPRADVEERLAEAVYDLVGGATGPDLLRFLTDRDVADAAGTSAARVRRAFSRRAGTERLDRRRMLDVATAKALESLDTACAAQASRWRWAAGRYREGSGFQVAEALLDVCSVTSCEQDLKLAHVAQALAEDDECLRDLLRYAASRRRAHYRAAVLELLERAQSTRPHPADVEALTLLASLIAGHVSQQQRLGEHVAHETLARVFAHAWDAAVGGPPCRAQSIHERGTSHSGTRSAKGRA